MPVTTPTKGTGPEGELQWCRLVRRLATRSGSDILLVYVPDGTHDRIAVLKRLPPGLATDAGAVEKFRVEARIAAQLEHPAIVRVLELVESVNDDFFVMEYVRGGNLRELMDALAKQRRTLPLDCVLLIAIDLCAALDHAHHLCDANGTPTPVLHRELSPSKVLLGADGTVKLTGFGAPITNHRRPRTDSVGYTSPERCIGETMDARSDLFALGVLLYELSSGERLFPEGTTDLQIMTRMVRGDMPRPSEIRRGYPRELENILMRLMAREREQRYQSAAELQADLESFLWGRWPTASKSLLAKMVSSVFPDGDVANGSTELERIDPFNEKAVPPGEEPIVWLGPVPFAKPYPRSTEAPPEIRESRPKKFAEASSSDVMLGKPGPASKREDLRDEKPAVSRTRSSPQAVDARNEAIRRAAAAVLERRSQQKIEPVMRAAVDERAATVDELAIPVEQPKLDSIPIEIEAPKRNANMLPAARTRTAQPPIAIAKGTSNDIARGIAERAKSELSLGTPGKAPTPLGPPSERAVAFEAAKGQYQRPEALDETSDDTKPMDPDTVVMERLRARRERALAAKRMETPSAIARVELQRVATPRHGMAREEIVRAASPPIELVHRKQPRPPTPHHEPVLEHRAASPRLDAPAIRISTPEPIVFERQQSGWSATPTLVVMVLVVLFGVGASAWAVLRTTHERSQLPEVVAAQPAPPTASVTRTAAAPAPTPTPEAVAPVTHKAHVAKKPPPMPGRRADDVAITALEIANAQEPAVRPILEHALGSLGACYHEAWAAALPAPKVELKLQFEVDRHQLPVKVAAIGGGTNDTLATCAAKVAKNLRGLPSDARVTVSLEFRPL